MIKMYLVLTFLFHEEGGLHSSHRVVHYTLVLTKGAGVSCCHSDHKLSITSCGDDSAILDP